MDTDIVYLGGDDYNPDVTSLLLYYYYGGVAYLSLKQYDRAMQFFSVVISAPAEQVCVCVGGGVMICMVEANDCITGYHRAVLCSFSTFHILACPTRYTLIIALIRLLRSRHHSLARSSRTLPGERDYDGGIQEVHTDIAAGAWQVRGPSIVRIVCRAADQRGHAGVHRVGDGSQHK